MHMLSNSLMGAHILSHAPEHKWQYFCWVFFSFGNVAFSDYSWVIHQKHGHTFLYIINTNYVVG
jgi:hypothetical protein